MLQLTFPAGATRSRSLAFFLAAEEWAAATLPEGEYFFVWQQGRPTVICGRNQEIEKEVDIAHCRARGIDIVRRRSGGGAVVADDGNFMVSFIAPRPKGVGADSLFRHYASALARALSGLGVEQAEVSGRNDICIGSRKISGGAFYALPGWLIAHFTLLFSTPAPECLQALTPSRAKLESHGVRSVAARITSLQDEGISLSRDEFPEALIAVLATGRQEVYEADIRAIETLEQRYHTPEYLNLNPIPKN